MHACNNSNRFSLLKRRRFRMLALLMLAFGNIKAGAHGQPSLTLRLNAASFEEFVKKVESTSSYKFLFGTSTIRKAYPVTINAVDQPIKSILATVFAKQPLDYALRGNLIVVKYNPHWAPPIGDVDRKISVEGKVKDSKGDPMIGLHVKEKGSASARVTDGNGLFRFESINENAVLVVSGVNIETKEISVNGRPSLQIDVDYVVKAMTETVVLAYATAAQTSNTGAVTVVKGKDIETLPNVSFDRSLQGKVPGLLVTAGNGQPGGGVSNFLIRGIGTGTNPADGSTIRNPLIVVDGVPVTQDYIQRDINSGATPISNPLAQLNPQDIETISVLKDASAIALYGSRASNGVILVTTKKGKAGKPLITIRHQTDISGNIKPQFDLLTPQEYMTLLYDTYKNVPGGNWTDASIKSDLIAKFPNIVRSPGDTTFYAAEDWFRSLYSNSAITLNNDISFSGGTDKSTYYLGLGYHKQNGALMHTGYDRTSLRYNSTHQFLPWLNVGLNSTFSYNVQQFASTAESSYDVNGMPFGVSPLVPLKDIYGQYIPLYNGYGIPSSSLPGTQLIMPNPVLTMQYNTNKNIAYRGLGNFFASIDFLKYFKFRTSLGIDFMLANSRVKKDPRLSELLQTTNPGFVGETYQVRTQLIPTNTLNFSYSFPGEHHLGALAGFEAQKTVVKSLSGSANGFTSPFYDMVSSGAVRNVSDSYTEETLQSFFGQLNYDYRNRYFLTGSGRRDGSSKFGPRERHGNYWSVGAGWIVSEEKLVNRLSFINFLKIRASAGTSGNAGSIGRNLRFNTLRFVNYGGTNPAVQVNSPGNPDIKWEQTFNTDIGLEFKLFNERISFTGDIYKRKITNLLYALELPGQTGWLQLTSNIGEMENKGIELSLAADLVRTGHFTLNLAVNWSTNKNKLISANPANIISGTLINKVGEPFNSFYLPIWAGVNRDNGMPQWLDSSGNATIKYPNTIADRRIVGKIQPDGFGGATLTARYKGLELSAVFYYQYGNQVYDAASVPLLNDGSWLYGYLNQRRDALNYWKKPGDISPNPRRLLNNLDQGYSQSTRFLHDGDYVQLNNLYLGYTLLPKWSLKMGLKSVKLFAQANNIAMWTHYPGINPGAVKTNGTAEFAYPLQKTYSLGLNFTL